MAAPPAAAAASAIDRNRARSLFDLPSDFFDSCRLILPGTQSALPPPPAETGDDSDIAGGEEEEGDIAGGEAKGRELNPNGEAEAEVLLPRWTCHTCKAEFESLQDQRFHFKSDVHRLNVKLSIAGKNTVKEEDFDELGGDSLFEDVDVSSISGSEDEFEKGSTLNNGISGRARESVRQKLYLHLNSGETVSVWRCLILDEAEEPLLGNSKIVDMGNTTVMTHVEEGELINRLKRLAGEPRDKTQLRIMLLLSGGHFAGCVFDGNSIIAHKTFHRYVVRAKAGKKQSAQDASGKVAHSAGSSLRRYNEVALKKEIQDLLVTWKPYIESSLCIFIYAPSRNRQMLFDRERPPTCVISQIPLKVRRPTLKEAKRLYYHMTHITNEMNGKASLEGDATLYSTDERKSNKPSTEAQVTKHVGIRESASASRTGVESLLSKGENDSLECLSKGETESVSPNENEVTPLHEAAKSGDAQRTLELLEQGLDPCIKDPRGRTPFMLATEKEVRNTFRRFMALNLDKWDWHAANVPSPLTKEMEDSQAAKQAEKDAKRKAKAKELKKLRKAKEKTKAQADAPQNASSSVLQGQQAAPTSALRPQSQFGTPAISKEEEQKRALAAEREKRAAAAERRIAALNVRAATPAAAAPSSSEPESGANDVLCTCCNVSLAGKVPFHRYHYKYCSTSCMYVHKQILEDG